MTWTVHVMVRAMACAQEVGIDYVNVVCFVYNWKGVKISPIQEGNGSKEALAS